MKHLFLHNPTYGKPFNLVLFIIFLGVFNQTMTAQSVGIGTNEPDPSALLELNSSSQGLLLPRMNTDQRDGILNPSIGLQIFNTDDMCTDIYDGLNWIKNCGFKVTGEVLGDAWVASEPFGGEARIHAVGFSIADKGYIGTGHNESVERLEDFWEFDPNTNTWAQKADVGGGTRSRGLGLSFYGTGLIGFGSNQNGSKNDLWEYSPGSNTWTQKADCEDVYLDGASGFVAGGQLFVMPINNFGEYYMYYEPVDLWLTRDDYPGIGRKDGVGFSIDGKGYFGLGHGGEIGYLNDFWQYDPITDSWTQIPDFPGEPRVEAVAIVMNNSVYVGSGRNQSFEPLSDFWEFDPSTNTWTEINSLEEGLFGSVGFSINEKAYMGTGTSDYLDLQAITNAFYEYGTGPIGDQYEPITPDSSKNSYSTGTWTKFENSIYNSNSGNVGIGNDAPFSSLDVTGDILTSVHSEEGGEDNLNASAEQIVRSIGHKTTALENNGFVGLKLKVGPYGQNGSNNGSRITFQTWGNNISTSRDVVEINEYGDLDVVGKGKFDGGIDVNGSITFQDGTSLTTAAAPTTALVPIGSIVAWHKSMNPSVSLSTDWVECNGQVINNLSSPYHTMTVPDLNGNSRFLRGGSTSGTLQDHALQDHKHNTGGHTHQIFRGGSNGDSANDVRVGSGSYSNAVSSVSHANILNATDANIADETRPINMSVVWVMRIK